MLVHFHSLETIKTDIGMQLIISEEENLSCGDYQEHQRRQQTSEMINYRGLATGAGDPILSDDLRDQFETMKRISRQVRRGSNDDLRHGVDDSYSNSDNISDAEVRKEEQRRRATTAKDLKRKEREAAIATAVKVDNEINQWRDGIAHLEALLLAEEETSKQSSSMEHLLLRQEQQEEVRTNGNNVPLGIREIAYVAHNINGNIVDADADDGNI